MSMSLHLIEGEYKIFSDTAALPTKKRKADGSVVYFIKKQDYLSVSSYWAYSKDEDGCWNLDRVYNNPPRRMRVRSDCRVSPEAMLYQLCDREYRSVAEDCHNSPIGERTPLKTVYWSHELDGKSIMILFTRYPKMTPREIMMVLENEGATVDAQGIIHRK